MSKTLILSPEARAEFDSSYDFYESRQEGLGEAFADSVNAVFKRIEVSPQCHRCVVNDIRRAVVSKFPYCVYYREYRPGDRCFPHQTRPQYLEAAIVNVDWRLRVDLCP